MTRREIATVACRIFALAMFGYGWAQVLSGLVHRISVSRALEFGMVRADRRASVVGLAWLAVSGQIWLGAPLHAARMVDDDPEPVVTTGISSREVLTLACCVVGLWIAAPACIVLVNQGLQFALSS